MFNMFKKWFCVLYLLCRLDSPVTKPTSDKTSTESIELTEHRKAVSKDECEILVSRVREIDETTVLVSESEQFFGTWLSDDCEVRQGPEFLLRSYTFRRDGGYKLIQHYYWDESCSQPRLTAVAKGTIKLRQSLVYDDCHTTVRTESNVTIIPQDVEAAMDIDKMARVLCPEAEWKRSQPFVPIVIDVTRKHPLDPPIFRNITCFGNIQYAFNELKLVKMQVRPILKRIVADFSETPNRIELLLGDINTNPKHRHRYVPTGFQVALVKQVDTNYVTVRGNKYLIKYYCNICNALSSGDTVPTTLPTKPVLPPFVFGNWASMQCEIRPYGIYVKRRYHFSLFNFYFFAVHTLYYDQNCNDERLSIFIEGLYTVNHNPKRIPPDALNMDFRITRAAVTVYDFDLAEYMTNEKTCGNGKWLPGVEVDLTRTRGCLQFGYTLPIARYDIIKLGSGNNGEFFLFIGQPETSIMPKFNNDRPTSYQSPLVKCFNFY